MINRLLTILLTLIFCSQVSRYFSQNNWTLNQTPTYEELISAYKKLDEQHKEIELYAMGCSDTEFPIYVCIINGAGDSTETFDKCRQSSTILINNAIHPGEPDGVNASLIWIEEWIKSGKKTKDLPCVAFIPAYNVGGMLRRGSFSRANQEGPEEYGFRGNTQNLDLNRDFIKMDSPNAKTFARIFHALDPDVFVDTHVSNGADYQYTLTYISSMKERMAPPQANLVYEKLIPELTSRLKKKNWDLFPYVELKEETPTSGLVAFNDLPRYAMGYAALFHSIAFTVETHMLKLFPERVRATKDFISNLVYWTGVNSKEVEKVRTESQNWSMNQAYFKYNYSQTEKVDSILFKGYEETFPVSEVTGLKRLKYDRNKPYTRFIPWYKTYFPADSALIPEFIYVLPSAKEVIENLRLNNISFSLSKVDSTLDLATTKIVSFQSLNKPYEGHFYHKELSTERAFKEMDLPKETLIIPTRQKGAMFLLSTLIPEGEDSYFRWNYFDSYLQQKEYFSPYVFEDKAAQLLKQDPELAKEFQKKRDLDDQFRESQWDQLFFIYKHSPYYEQTDYHLPVYFSK
ncbi:MAG: hypothetical protein LW688_00430 [Cryomorphaceae bacterium]|nr:hypothetical protein [Cryomorphaceae bacterium]